jgi:putative ABC transport system permease protein
MVENILFIISSLVVVIGLAGLISTLLAGLNERRRELAILRSVGAGPRNIFLMLVLEGVLITSLGIVLGYLLLFVAIALLGSLPQLMFGLVLSQGLPSNQEWLLIFAIFLTGIFSSLIPGWRAWRISLADGLTPRL